MVRTDSVTPNVQRLRNIARQIMKDDGGVHFDEKLRQTGYTIYHAIDYSEIFSYIFLATLPYVLPDRGKRYVLNVGFNELVLHELLLSDSYLKFMLPSHRLEFRQLIATIHERELGELGSIVAVLEGKLRLGKRLLSALDRFDEAPADELTNNKLVTQIVNEAAEDAPSILLLARVASAQPHQRLRRLQEHIKLKPITAIMAGREEASLSNSSVFDKALYEFNVRRPRAHESTNRVDAYAVAYLSRLIDTAPDKVAFRFVSRSTSFEEVCVQLAENDIISGDVVLSLRHPRSFSAHVLARSIQRPVAKLAGQRLTAASTFLSALGELAGSDSTIKHASPTGDFDRSAETLASTVGDIERIAMLSSVTEAEGVRAQSTETSFTNVAHLVGLLRNHDEVRKAVQSRAMEVVDRLSTGTMAIADTIAASLVGDQPTIASLEASLLVKETRISQSSATDVTVARFIFAPVPFSLEFYSRFISNRLSKNEEPHSVLSQFIASADRHAPFERRLATSYLFGLHQDWTLSLRFVNAALDEKLSADTTPRHEGYYFRAVARRYARSWTPDNIIASLHDVARAHDIRSEVREPNDKDDPRYINERAILIDQARRAGVSDSTLVSLKANQNPIALWNRILKSNASIAYKLNALNNITFFYVESADKERTKQSLSRLIDFAGSNGVRLDDLPPSVQDTILSAKLLTNVFSTQSEEETARKRLEHLRKDPYVARRPLHGKPL